MSIHNAAEEAVSVPLSALTTTTLFGPLFFCLSGLCTCEMSPHSIGSYSWSDHPKLRGKLLVVVVSETQQICAHIERAYVTNTVSSAHLRFHHRTSQPGRNPPPGRRTPACILLAGRAAVLSSCSLLRFTFCRFLQGSSLHARAGAVS